MHRRRLGRAVFVAIAVVVVVVGERAVVTAANGASNVAAAANGGVAAAAPASIVLSATASDPDGTVQKVEFYSGTTLLAVVSGPPYGYTWTGVAAGSYSVGAMAYDNLGTKAVSPWRDVTVTSSVILSKAVFFPAIVPDYVRNYLLEIFATSADPAVSTPVATQDLGLPTVVNGECTADVRNTILGLAPGSYVATVSAITSQGSTLRSNSFAFTR